MKIQRKPRNENRALTLRLAAAAVAMFGFGYLLVPFYYLMCDVIGIGGRTADAVAEAPAAVDENRRIAVEFLTSVNEYAPWEFRPDISSLEVEPGRLYTVSFHARNLTQRPLTGQAIPSVAPGQSARYLKKVDCFCFRSQDFAPGETRELTVQFYLDPALPDYVDRLTLSYTMFIKPRVASAEDVTRS